MEPDPSEAEARYLDEATPPVDAEVARLEQLLARYRYRPASLPENAAASGGRFLVAPRVIQRALAAAAVVLVLGLAVHWLRADGGEGYAVRGHDAVARLERGRWLESGERSAWIEVGEIGEVELWPGARVRLDKASEEASALYLERGSLVAAIVADPGAFQVGTPAGLSIDLGCIYRLEVDERDVSHLEVTSGQVAFEAQGRTVFVPSDYATFAVPGRGPAAPLPLLVDPDIEALVRRVEVASEVAEDDLEAVRALDDSVVLYHLLRAPARAVREAALDALILLEELPAGVEREALLEDEAAWLAWHDEMSWRPAWRR